MNKMLLANARLGLLLANLTAGWESPARKLALPTHYNAMSGLDNGVPRRRKKGRS